MVLNIKRYYKDNFRVTTLDGQETAQDYIPFTSVPTLILADPNINSTQKLLLGLINSFYTNRKTFFASNKFLSASLGIKAGTVADLLTDLEKKGYIIRFFEDKLKRKRQKIELSHQFYNLIRYGNLGGVSEITDRGIGNNRNPDTEITEHTKQVILNKNTNLYGKLSSTQQNDNYASFVASLNKRTQRNFSNKDLKAKRQFISLLNTGVKLEEFEQVIDNAANDEFHISCNFKYLTPEFLTRADKFEKFKNIKPRINSRELEEVNEVQAKENFDSFIDGLLTKNRSK